MRLIRNNCIAIACLIAFLSIDIMSAFSELNADLSLLSRQQASFLSGKEIETSNSLVCILDGYLFDAEGVFLYEIDKENKTLAYLTTYIPEDILTGRKRRQADDLNVWTISSMDLSYPYLLISVSDGKSYSGFEVVDVSHHAEPQMLSRYTITEYTNGGIVESFGHRAVFLSPAADLKSSSLHTIDLSDPSNPVQQSSLELSMGVWEVLWDGGRHAYLLMGTGDNLNPSKASIDAAYLGILDLADFSSPQLVQMIELGKHTEISLVQDNIYAGTLLEYHPLGKHDLKKINLQDLQSPVIQSYTVEFYSSTFVPFKGFYIGWLEGAPAIGIFRIGKNDVLEVVIEYSFGFSTATRPLLSLTADEEHIVATDQNHQNIYLYDLQEASRVLQYSSYE